MVSAFRISRHSATSGQSQVIPSAHQPPPPSRPATPARHERTPRRAAKGRPWAARAPGAARSPAAHFTASYQTPGTWRLWCSARLRSSACTRLARAAVACPWPRQAGADCRRLRRSPAAPSDCARAHGTCAAGGSGGDVSRRAAVAAAAIVTCMIGAAAATGL